jgi:hypothetical protein
MTASAGSTDPDALQPANRHTVSRQRRLFVSRSSERGGDVSGLRPARATEQVALGRGSGICRKAVAVGRVSMNPISQLV